MILTLACHAMLQAQQPRGSIVGVVRADSAKPLADVSVTLEPGRVVVRSLSDGSFSFTSLAAGRYTIVARRVGYRPDSVTVTLTAGAHERVVLRPSNQMLEAVTVSALRAALPRVYERADRGLGAVMYADEIMESPLYNLQDLLTFSPRFQLAMKRSTYYVDGRPIRNDLQIPHKRDIAAIEVHRGYMGLREPELWLPLGQTLSSKGAIVLIWTRQYVERESGRTTTP